MFSNKPKLHPQQMVDLVYHNELGKYEAIQLYTPVGFILAARHKEKKLIRQFPFQWTTPDLRIEVVMIEDVLLDYVMDLC
jgi:hypothetical protein